jgi:hypothetical protein
MSDKDEKEKREEENPGGASSRFAERKPLADAVPKGEKGKPRYRVAVSTLSKTPPPPPRKNSNKEDRESAAKAASEYGKKKKTKDDK